jgi:hypothetical protein
VVGRCALSVPLRSPEASDLWATEGGLPTTATEQGCDGGGGSRSAHLRGNDTSEWPQRPDSIWPLLTAHGGDGRVPSGSDSVQGSEQQSSRARPVYQSRPADHDLQAGVIRAARPRGRRSRSGISLESPAPWQRAQHRRSERPSGLPADLGQPLRSVDMPVIPDASDGPPPGWVVELKGIAECLVGRRDRARSRTGW